VFGELNVLRTAEVVIGECAEYVIDRDRNDEQNGFKELVVKDLRQR
jgi:hypothetical protein